MKIYHIFDGKNTLCGEKGEKIHSHYYDEDVKLVEDDSNGIERICGEWCEDCEKVMKNKQKTFEYIIDLDERGEFRAHVEDYTGDSIFEFSNENFFYDDMGEVEFSEYGELWLVTDGFMEHSKDVKGLKNYLISQGIISRYSTLKFYENTY